MINKNLISAMKKSGLTVETTNNQGTSFRVVGEIYTLNWNLDQTLWPQDKGVKKERAIQVNATRNVEDPGYESFRRMSSSSEAISFASMTNQREEHIQNAVRALK